MIIIFNATNGLRLYDINYKEQYIAQNKTSYTIVCNRLINEHGR